MPSKRKGVQHLSCVILAAGLGTRMKSASPKVLHPLFDRPMLSYTVDAVRSLGAASVIVVTGKEQGPFKEAIPSFTGLRFAVQKDQKGTADALRSALGSTGKSFRGTVLVTTGDTPLLTSATLKKFLSLHRRRKSAISVLSFKADDPAGYGRIVRGVRGAAQRIVEEKDASPSEKAIHEVNSGVYAIETRAMTYLQKIKINPLKKEYYLTDIVDIAISNGEHVGVHCVGVESEFMGVNTRAELMQAHKLMSRRTVYSLMERGVSFVDADSVYISPQVEIGPDTMVYPGVFLHGNTQVGKHCCILPNVRIVDSTIRDGAIIKDGSVIESSSVGRKAQVGPYAHIRPESVIEDNAKVGNFVETKKSIIGKGSKAMHLSYIGDASLGSSVNIGAGTITCNYDGTSKHRTRIGDGVFIGSDTQLVAPVTIGDGAYIGAGSTITQDVPAGMLALSRVRQFHIKRKKK